MFRDIDTSRENGVIGDKSDVHEGIGSITYLVDTDTFVRDRRSDGRITEVAQQDFYQESDGSYVCPICGYDRSTYHTHTEVDSHTLLCENCDNVMLEWGRDA